MIAKNITKFVLNNQKKVIKKQINKKNKNSKKQKRQK